MESSNLMKELLLGTVSNSKGGFRTLPFIIANEAFEKLASYGLLPNMILYLMDQYGMGLTSGSNFIYMWSCASNFAPLIAAYVADSYVGRFSMIGFGSIISLMGMILLWLTTIIPGARPCNESGSECTNLNISQLTLLVSSFVLMSIGAGGIRSSSLAFGTDQLVYGGTRLANPRIIERFFNWYYVAASSSVVIALSLVVYIQDHFGWKVGFGIPVILMLLSAISFFLASPLYVKMKGTASSLTALIQVLAASWKKRQLTLSPESTDRVYYRRKGSRLFMPSDRMRFLNKACTAENFEEELTRDGTALDPWSLCTVDQVEELKAIVRVIPIWSTGIIISTTTNQSFQVVLAATMDRHITSNFEVPAGSLGASIIIVMVLYLILYDRVIMPLATKITGKPTRVDVKTRMGIGLLCSSIAMVIAAIIEGVRRKTAIEEGLSENPKGQVHMSAYWYLFSYLFTGVSQALFIVGQNEFFYSELPKSMASVATNLYGLGLSLASVFSSVMLSSVDSITSKGGQESWVSDNVNKGHFDYYYWLLAGLCSVNLFCYIICCKAYGASNYQEGVSGDGDEVGSADE